MTTRRSFMGSILAAGFAPAAIASGVLMPVRKIVVPADPFGTRGFIFWTGRQHVQFSDVSDPNMWGDSIVGSPEYRAAQKLANRHLRYLMDNMALANNPNIELRAYGERRTA